MCTFGIFFLFESIRVQLTPRPQAIIIMITIIIVTITIIVKITIIIIIMLLGSVIALSSAGLVSQ